MISFTELEKKYFDRPLSRGFICLYVSETVTMIAGGLAGIFVPIFLYNLFDHNLQKVIIYYGIGHLLYALSVFLGGRFLGRFGFKRALQVSVFFAVLFYIILYYISPANTAYLIVALVLVLALFRIFHWIPYHVDFAKFTNRRNRSRQISILLATASILGIFMPLTAGLIITRSGFGVIFWIAILLWLVSGVPYLFLPRTGEKFSWSYGETWRQFCSRKMRGVVVASMANGAQNFIGLVIWPIFIYQLLKGNYFQVGALSTLIMGFTVIVQLAIGRRLDLQKSKKKYLRWGSVLYSTGWFIKAFISTAFQIFVAGVYHSIAGVFLGTSWHAMVYELAADQGHYIDEFTVLREMAINLGKAIIMVLILITLLYFSVQWVFALAAVLVLVTNILGRNEHERLIVRFDDGN